MSERYTVYGMDASYFTQKLLTLMAYKCLDVDYRHKTLATRDHVEAAAKTHLIPVLVTPSGQWLHDSTPLAFMLDDEHPASAVVPPADPAHALDRMLCRMLEDYFDEWLTRPAMHFRWFHEADRQTSGVSLARDLAGLDPATPLDAATQPLVDNVLDFLTRWGRSTAPKIAAGPDHAGAIAGDFARLVSLLDQHFRAHAFLLGDRPCLADFALYGPLKAHFLADPTPHAVIEAQGPAVRDYAGRMAAARAAAAPEWPAHGGVPETLAPVLQHVGQDFHAYLVANRAALQARRDSVEIDTAYGPLTLATRPYTERTRADTAADLAGYEPAVRARLEAELAPLGLWRAYTL
ncbi:glutathione S-transferase [Rhodothalassium salexigens DSM 2132]|uniref:Glutathione S-transferase n=1 Tax=Rhodothalassium salexigens DSM 2132 TaxID=1188247 RepID=A0A4R2PQT6_RHOSA|nr:glutathione S-transferase N-terminal domain-containing protein [Rhodothalassium salexigens]MBB4210028.1 glutathione S-transferase [Rhodothalassium salexigens DSM 2132]MBK1637601.1 hypothetical protein [Rhodothalassium salexigens DSM 2132]TCP38193.1 glutathione S-transferase [Rhodothalassium salexigens DSM 2132]